MFLKILAHPVFVNLNFHMPMIVDLSHPLIMLQGENGSGKSTLLHSIYYALRGQQVDGYIYRLDGGRCAAGRDLSVRRRSPQPAHESGLLQGRPAHAGIPADGKPRTSDAEHVPARISRALPDGTVLLLDEPEMALSVSNQRRILKMLLELADSKKFRIICARTRPC